MYPLNGSKQCIMGKVISAPGGKQVSVGLSHRALRQRLGTKLNTQPVGGTGGNQTLKIGLFTTDWDRPNFRFFFPPFFSLNDPGSRLIAAAALFAPRGAEIFCSVRLHIIL